MAKSRVNLIVRWRRQKKEAQAQRNLSRESAPFVSLNAVLSCLCLCQHKNISNCFTSVKVKFTMNIGKPITNLSLSAGLQGKGIKLNRRSNTSSSRFLRQETGYFFFSIALIKSRTNFINDSINIIAAIIKVIT